MHRRQRPGAVLALACVLQVPGAAAVPGVREADADVPESQATFGGRGGRVREVDPRRAVADGHIFGAPRFDVCAEEFEEGFVVEFQFDGFEGVEAGAGDVVEETEELVVMAEGEGHLGEQLGHGFVVELPACQSKAHVGFG